MRKLLAFLLFAVAASAQQTPPATRAIYLTVTHLNAPAPDLALSDFNVKGVHAKSLQGLADTPLWVGLLIDNSGSLRVPAQRERIEAISEALPVMLRSGTDTAMLVNFNEDFYLDQSATTDIAALVSVLKQKAETRGGSAILDALQAGSSYLLKNLPAAGPRVIFLFSDCGDNASRTTSDEAVRQLLLNGTRLYIFKEPSDGWQIRVEERGTEMLKVLAEKTGGRLIKVEYGKKSKHSLAAAFRMIEPELRSWYRIYVEVPQPSDTKFTATPFKIEPLQTTFEVHSPSDFITIGRLRDRKKAP
jgi:hypothetical protein